ncbi:hypothetical protein LXL04_024555 [Taraxacum kok-saghyz]
MQDPNPIEDDGAMEDDDVTEDGDVNGCTRMLMDILEEIPNPSAQGFYDALEEANEPLWDGCENYTKLQAASELLNWKSEYNVSEAAYDHILPIIKRMLSKGEKLVENSYETKKEAYEKAMVAKYGDDTSCYPLLDSQIWLEVSGGKKKGRVFGFGLISDPESFLTGTSTENLKVTQMVSVCCDQAEYERVQVDMRAEMEAKTAEMEAKAAAEMEVKVAEMEVKHHKMCEELDAKAAVLEVKQKQIDEKYEKFEKMFYELQNMRES